MEESRKVIEEIKPKVFEGLFESIFLRKKILDGETEEVFKFCEIVYFKHFSDRKIEKVDLLQEGFYGILRLISDDPNEKSSKYTPGTGSVNFAYTKVRNCMSNFLRKRKPDLMEDDKDIKNMTDAYSDGTYDLIIDRIFKFLNSQFDVWLVSPLLREYVMVYFKDKFGEKVELMPVNDVDLEFVVQYEYLINYAEYLISTRFLNGAIFINDIKEMSRILESEGDLPAPIKLLVRTMDKDLLVKVLYILSGNNFKFPSKRKLLRTDFYLSIYKSIKQGRFSLEEAAKFYEKPLEAVVSIEKKYDKIYDQK